jgi:cyclophilin family peptidyl-prolyl cis-trans isomerase
MIVNDDRAFPSEERGGEISMLRRLLVPAAILTAFVCLVLIPRMSLAQEAPAPGAAGQESPTPDAAAPAVPAAPAGQETPTPDAATPAAPAAPAGQEAAPAATPDAQQARAEYVAKFGEWKELIKRLRTLRNQYQLADEPTRAAMEGQWKEAIATTDAFLPSLVTAAANAYRAAPNEDRELTSFLVKILKDDVEHDRYESAALLADVLIEGQCDSPEIYQAAGIANFSLNNLDKTLALLDKAQANNAKSGDSPEPRKEVEKYLEYWKQEQECRQKEAAADDLPRVKFTTNKGNIVLELFENEAPETVGNFISLIEKGFYDGLTFHRVISGFMAQAGCPTGDGSGGPGYAIYDECAKPEARKHFRGSLSMAKTSAPNSGGSQFFVTFRPTPNLNGLHTVFGRVIEGMDAVDRIQRREPGKDGAADPDTIVKAEVLRKRNHEYLPRKVE